jgi:hypothetical protein
MGIWSPVKAACGQTPWDLRNSIAWNAVALDREHGGGCRFREGCYSSYCSLCWDGRSCEVAVRLSCGLKAQARCKE